MSRRARRLIGPEQVGMWDDAGMAFIAAPLPEHKLWCMVMMRAFLDVEYLTAGLARLGPGFRSRSHMGTPALKNWPSGPLGEVLGWINSESTEPASLAWICEYLTERPGPLKENFRKRIDGLLNPIRHMLPGSQISDTIRV